MTKFLSAVGYCVRTCLAITVFIAVNLTNPLKIYAQSNESTDDMSTAPVFDDAVKIQQWIKGKNIPAMGVGLIRDGKLQDIKIYGNLKAGDPANYDAIFDIASLTKTMTTMVTLKLVSLQKWDLDEPLFNYWTDPDVKNDPLSKKITSRHILMYASGLPNKREQSQSRKLAFDFEPGTKYQYSEEGLEYLRHALESKFHQSFEKLADSLVIRPLGLKDTHFTWDTTMEKRFAVRHSDFGRPLPINKNTTANAGNYLKTTLADYGKFLVWVMNGAGLSPDVFNQMVTPVVKIKKDKFMGLGWCVYTNVGTNEYALSHAGSDAGARCIVFALPKSKQGLIIFTNSENGVQVYMDMVRSLLGENGKAIIKIETN